MALCAAVKCKSRVGENPGKTFHSFPFWNPALLEVWISNLGRSTFWRPSPFSVLCSDHFEDSYFEKIGDVVHIRGDAVPTLFFSDVKTNKNSDGTSEKPEIISVISLENLFKSSMDKETDPLLVFHEKIDEICKQKEAQERKKVLLQLLLSSKCFAINQQKIQIVLNRQRLLRRKMMQNAMIMILLTQQGLKINS